MGWVLLALIVWLSGEVDDELNWVTRVVAKGAFKLIVYVAGFLLFIFFLS